MKMEVSNKDSKEGRSCEACISTTAARYSHAGVHDSLMNQVEL